MIQEKDSIREENFVAGENSQLQFLSAVRAFNEAETDEEAINATNQIFHLAEKGHAGAQFFLGLLYYEGIIYEQDYSMAHLWFVWSAQKGNVDAMYICWVFSILKVGA